VWWRGWWRGWQKERWRERREWYVREWRKEREGIRGFSKEMKQTEGLKLLDHYWGTEYTHTHTHTHTQIERGGGRGRERERKRRKYVRYRGDVGVLVSHFWVFEKREKERKRGREERGGGR
jgi:hypothetical protein